MLNKSLDNTSVIKLKQLIASRFGKGLEIRQLMDMSGSEISIVTMKGSDLHIPIHAEGHFLGTAVVPAALDLNEEKKSDLAQMVRLVLEPTMYNWYLERKETNLQQLADAQFPTDNLKLFGEEIPPINETLEQNDADSSGGLQRSQLISNLIHLEGKNPLMVKKIALQLHEMTHRWAFVPFADVKDQLQTALDISKMGAMTIFVDEVQALSSQEQDLLLEYLAAPRCDEEPLVITASSLTMGELKNSDLHPHLLDEVEINSFEVERAPLGYQNLKEVLELFFLRDKNS